MKLTSKGKSATKYSKLLKKVPSNKFHSKKLNQERKEQSAMEYLMTYGWSILLIAIVLVAMFELGMFGSSGSSSTTCIPQVGFLCSSPLLNQTGYLSVQLGTLQGSSQQIVGDLCINSSIQPTASMFGGIIPITPSSEYKIQLTFRCFTNLVSMGSHFSGYLWLDYTDGSISELGTVSVQVTAGSSSSIDNGNNNLLQGSDWISTSAYPTEIEYQSCATSSNYLYCVGGSNSIGITNAVYYAPISSSGVGAWQTTNSYPTPIEYQSCATSSNYLYCVGGANSISFTNTVYYAPISSSGVGAWQTTNSYPTVISYQSCATSSNYLYCVGGYNGIGATNVIYYAPISSSGVGAWQTTNSYPTPIDGQNCISSSNYLYCIDLEAIYYASISSSGVGIWQTTNSYPATSASKSCASSSNYLYCVGGYFPPLHRILNFVYYAPISSSGVGTWQTTNSYPTTIQQQSCASSSNYLYCVGGYNGIGATDAVYYAPVSSSGGIV